MLAHKVLVQHMLRSGSGVRPDHAGQQRHPRHLLQHHRMIDRLRRAFTPGEGAMAEADHPGDVHRVYPSLPEGLHNYLARVLLVVLIQLCLT